VNHRTAVLETIYARLVQPTGCGSAVIVDHEGIGALTSMPPDLKGTRRGDLWVESRSERLDGLRTLFAVISRHEDGGLLVTAHSDRWAMNTELRRISEKIVGRMRGVRVRDEHAHDLLHRTAVNEHGAVFHVGGLYLDAGSGRIVIDLLELDEDGEPIAGTECGVYSLDGWEAH